MNIDKVREIDILLAKLTPGQVRLLTTSILVTLEYHSPEAVSIFHDRAKRWVKENEVGGGPETGRRGPITTAEERIQL